MKQIYSHKIENYDGKHAVLTGWKNRFMIYGIIYGRRLYIEKIIYSEVDWLEYTRYILIVFLDKIFLIETEDDYLELVARVI